MVDHSGAGAEVRVVHVFDAPPDLVFAAWTDPDQVARWWAPPGFQIPHESVTIEPRIGGRFDFTMVSADGSARFPYRAEIAELVASELLVLRAEPIPGAGIPQTVTRVTLQAEGERTRMTLTSGPYDDAVRPNARAGWIAAVAGLDDLLAEPAAER